MNGSTGIGLTKDYFEWLKKDYAVYGTHMELDEYRNEHAVRDETPRCVIHTMWHPMTDAVSIAEYGRNISSMVYALIYDDPGIQHGDTLMIRGVEHEIVGIKYFNTHVQLDAKKKVSDGGQSG